MTDNVKPDSNPADVDGGDEKMIKFIAGVFLDPETELFEVRGRDETVDPYSVMLGAVSNYVQQLMGIIGASHSGPAGARMQKPQIVRAQGPLPPGMRP